MTSDGLLANYNRPLLDEGEQDDPAQPQQGKL